MASLLSLLLGVGCATFLPDPMDPIEFRRAGLRAEGGPLRLSPEQVPGPFVSEYLEFVDRLDSGRPFAGSTVFGTIEGPIGALGAVATLVPEGIVPKATLVAFHGYLSHSAYNIPALRRLAEAGYPSVSIDLPGHGFSEGRRADVDGFSVYAETGRMVMAWLRERGGRDLPAPYVALGHSAGGAAALEMLLAPDVGFEAGVLLDPLVEPRRFAYVRTIAVLLGPFVATVPPRGFEEGFLGAPFVPLSWIRALGRWRDGLRRREPVPGVPVLFVRGDLADFMNERVQERILLRLFPRLESFVVSGGGHIVFDLGAGQELAVGRILEYLDLVVDDIMVKQGSENLGADAWSGK